MNLKALWLLQPGLLIRSGILVWCVLITLLVGYLHTLTGLAYEFHVFFILPVLIVSWFNGKQFGYGMAVLAAVEWFIADQALATDQANVLPLIFNTLMRLAIFVFGAWLIGDMRRVLMRESRLAREDTLTQLPNRRQFHERGLQAFAQAQRQSASFTAVFFDLDRFKEVNDTLGHDTGDALLAGVARVIREQVRASDIPGRLGGDEFALLLPNMNAQAASVYVEKLRERLLAAMQEKGWPVTFSIGVASYEVAPLDFDMAIKQADALMYEVKRGGRDRILQQEF
ncbi:MAG: GGDEF domain-containing protein [Gammaproteobacteria bacterium]|uniref:GGDEF domain-containing protein n=1 Tax=Rhodoferax sp. TaxID=50421 RepID=UPI0017AA612A|nr:GGDEF domain-containing protein [Rhodoferax sp.]MBU3898838.1 GGDEF domain-containing protein [Gammaproteobacteria bacterium]MBA3059460.1 GGDEF domain-containing protein [Rhodoferax sp.]MBU3999029.1 GGDEF domain-containing protein [Gammaproteobacteria bacterium]MBU4019314.1 GGDEF domain-containing protein [Gammaproteobacteria bacterium]MBU4081878.1 GGDEF domain-containing protein [Gammaproteobacteria bacterium]